MKNRIKQSFCISINNDETKSKLFLLSFFLEIMIIITFVFLKDNLSNLKEFILIESTILIGLIGFLFGLLPTLLISLFIVFIFTSFVFYNVIFKNYTFNAYYIDYIWVLFFVLTTYICGSFGNIYNSTIEKLNFYKSEINNHLSTDVITSFKNLKTFLFDLKEEIDRYNRYESKFSVMIIKIQYINEFKQMFSEDELNNLFIKISDKINILLRFSDKKYKISEDKFALTFPGTPEIGLEVIKTKLKKEISEIELNIKNNKSQSKVFKIESQISFVEYTNELENPMDLKKFLEKNLQYDV